MRENEGRLSPFEFDNPKDAENSPFEASSVLVVKANVLHYLSALNILLPSFFAVLLVLQLHL